MAPDSERRDTFAIYRKLMLSELSDEISEIDWKTYVNEILKVTENNALEANETEEVVVYATEYMKNISGIINNRFE